MTLFERYPKTTLTALLFVLGSAGCLALEWGANAFFGLGNVVLYDTHPLYGYRPRPNQQVSRNHNIVVHINNLGLRAENDWDAAEPHNKILFLGDSVTYGGSYIANTQLFSHLVTKTLPRSTVERVAGNAGVNGWGVSNVYAFIKTARFLPANIYISVFPEGDFYRGINRIGGQPFWTVSPRYALEELFHYGIYQLQLRKNPPTEHYTENHPGSVTIVENAVQDLKALDHYLKSQGKTHLIYITPSRDQVIEHAKKDPIVESLLAQYDIQVHYISDRLPAASTQEKESWFHDPIHLSSIGHQIWANVIASDLSEKVSS
jgi:lysophospholipase L1-like esterase